ncbi:GNAT family acetyltransferase [Billgrantia saliphila]|uniref:GNAT family acetyltransferase n=1 Tax=Billgrantia saliphila TaxID=1848458 RepID=UPI000CE43EC1|nr:GNAT family acetyltransferase [Halomonas saliphila]
MQIREFSEADRQAVITLWQDCGLTRPWNDPNKDIDRKLTVQPELFLVGELEGRLIASAMAGFDGHRGSIYYLAVDPRHQHKGYGLTLMARVEKMLQAMGCPKLNVIVRSSNEEVSAFYGRLGYSTDDVVCIGKRLIPDV